MRSRVLGDELPCYIPSPPPPPPPAPRAFARARPPRPPGCPGPVSSKEGRAGGTVADFYKSVYAFGEPHQPLKDELEANKAAINEPCETRSQAVEIAAPVAEGCGPLQGERDGVTMGGWRSKTTIKCVGQVGGRGATVKIAMARTTTEGEITPWSGEENKRACLRAKSGVPLALDGPWPAVALHVAGARLRDTIIIDTKDGKLVLSQREWNATAALIRSAIRATGGVPRALRPFVRWFMAIDPAFWSQPGFAEAGYGSDQTKASGSAIGKGSVRAFFARELTTAVEAVLGAACARPTKPYSSTVYDAYLAALQKIQKQFDDQKCSSTSFNDKDSWTPEKKMTCEKLVKDKNELKNARKKDHAEDEAQQELYENPRQRQPCETSALFWEDIRRQNLGRARSDSGLNMPLSEQLFELDAQTRARMFSFEGLLVNSAPANLYRDLVAIFAAFTRVGLAVSTARHVSVPSLFYQGDVNKVIRLAEDMPAADTALLHTWQKLASAHVYAEDERLDKNGFNPVVRKNWQDAINSLDKAHPGFFRYILALDPRMNDPANQFSRTMSTNFLFWMLPLKQECDAEFSARMSDWLAYSASGVGAPKVYQIVSAQIIRLAFEASQPAAAMVLRDVILSVLDAAVMCTSRLGRTNLTTLGARVIAELDRLPAGETFTPTFV